MNFDYDFYNLVLSEITSRIASDQIIIEAELRNLEENKPSKKFSNFILRNRANILLLNEFVFLGRHFADSPLGTNNLLEAINLAESAFKNAGVRFDKKRNKPLIDVIGDKKITSALIKSSIALIVLEDNALKKISLSIRRRGDYVTVKILGGKFSKNDLFLKDSAQLAINLFGYYGAKLRFTQKDKKRLIFLRMHLSNQMPLLYNK